MAISELKIKEFFFDRLKIMEATEKAQVKVLSKIGAFVWRRAKTSIKIKKGTAPPGAVPFGHTTTTRKKTNKKTGVTKTQPASPLPDAEIRRALTKTAPSGSRARRRARASPPASGRARGYAPRRR